MNNSINILNIETRKIFNNRQLIFPTKVFLDSFNNLQVADTGRNRIVKYTHNEECQVMAGGYGAGNNFNQLDNPSSIYIDKFDNLYVADTNNNRILKYAYEIEIAEIIIQDYNDNIQNMKTKLKFPTSIFVDNFQNIFVSESTNHRVLMFKYSDNQSIGQVVAGSPYCLFGSDINSLYYPVGIQVDSNENLQICDSLNHRVIKKNIHYNNEVVIAGNKGKGIDLDQLNQPTDVFLDKKNNVQISDTFNNRILKVTQSKVDNGIELQLGINLIGGIGNEDLYKPRGIYLNKYGDLQVADSGNHRIMYKQSLSLEQKLHENNLSSYKNFNINEQNNDNLEQDDENSQGLINELDDNYNTNQDQFQEIGEVQDDINITESNQNQYIQNDNNFKSDLNLKSNEDIKDYIRDFLNDI